MTAFVLEPQPIRRGPTPGVALGVAVMAVVAVFALFAAGVTFFGLAIAYPIAIPVAQAHHLTVRVADAALAERLADFWWVFAGAALATFGAAAVVANKAVTFLSPGD